MFNVSLRRYICWYLIFYCLSLFSPWIDAWYVQHDAQIYPDTKYEQIENCIPLNENHAKLSANLS